MKINILSLLDGAKEARGLTVIIDVFRAFTTEAYFFERGAEKIIPVGDKESAVEYSKIFENSILCGERRGIKIEGFDHGNSPSEIEKLSFDGKIIIHTTSAGTQGISNAKYADEIIGGSLVSAAAIARYIKSRNPDEVSLVSMGLDAVCPTEEDDLAAEYIKSILEEKPIQDIKERAQALRYTSGAKFFDAAQNDVFPTRDFYLCTEVDKFDFIVKLQKNENGINYMMRVDV